MKYGPKSNKIILARMEYAWNAWSAWIIGDTGETIHLNLIDASFFLFDTGAWELRACILNFWFSIGRYEK